MPEAPKNIKAYREEFFTRVQKLLAEIEKIVLSGKGSQSAAINALENLKHLTEDINQRHHEALCIAALIWLKDKHKRLHWTWQPTNTGSGNQGDIEGRDEKKNLVVVAECTASIRYVGTLRIRTNSAIKKLSECRSRHKYFFVANEDMLSAAKGRVKNLGYDVIVKKFKVS